MTPISKPSYNFTASTTNLILSMLHCYFFANPLPQRGQPLARPALTHSHCIKKRERRQLGDKRQD